MKRNTGLRIAIVVCVLALALTAAYYYGTARAASVVALPAEITLGNASLNAATTATTAAPVTTAGSAPTAPTTMAPTASTTGTTAGTTRSSTPTSQAKSSSTPTTVQRHVVTTVWDWNCDNGNWGSGHGGM